MNGEAWRFEAFVQGVGGRIKESLLVTIRIFKNLVRTDKIQFDLILFDPDFLNTFEFSLAFRCLQKLLKHSRTHLLNQICIHSRVQLSV